MSQESFARQVAITKGLEFGVGVDFSIVDHFSTHFAKWTNQDGDLLVQLFFRNGEDDVMFDGYFKPNCGTCGSALDGMPHNPVCNTCRHSRPRPRRPKIHRCSGRLETKFDKLFFPPEAVSAIRRAADAVWAGDVQGPVYTAELGAFVLKFMRVGSTIPRVLEAFLRKFDAELEKLATFTLSS